MRASKLLEQLQTTIERNKQLDKELAEENPWRTMHEADPIVYISIGPTCIPITLAIDSTGTLYGSLNGLSLRAKLDVPPELYQRWFDLQQEIMKHLDK